MMNIEQEAKLRELMQIFLEENKRLNLSAYRTEEACWTGNILDSLAFLEIFPNPCHPERSRRGTSCHGSTTLTMTRTQHDTQDISILDIGTGGGFPLLPLVICLPDIQFTGIDSTKKKIDAVQRITNILQLSNINLIWGRAEDFKQQYDLVLARALAPLKKLLPVALPLVKPNGHIVLWKSMTIDAELKESEPIQHKLGLSLLSKHVYELPGDYGKRQLLVFEKI